MLSDSHCKEGVPFVIKALLSHIIKSLNKRQQYPLTAMDCITSVLYIYIYIYNIKQNQSGFIQALGFILDEEKTEDRSSL